MSRARQPFRAAAGARPRTVVGLAMAAGAMAAFPTAGSAASAPVPKIAPGFTIQKLAAGPKGTTNCDDLAYLDGHLFMTCQNATLSVGGGGNSTIVEYAGDGSVLNAWSLTDKADGIAGDPLNHRLIVTLNEDSNSHLATITPSAPAGQQVTNYHYSVDPASHTATGPLHTGGGTDSVSVDSRGHIFISASYGIARTGTAVFKTMLTPPKAAGGAGLATLSPTYLDNATAANGNTGSGTVSMKLVDVDSNAIVPYTSPRYGGDFVIDDQTALALVFSSNIDAGTGLTELHTSYGLDDIRWATTNGGTLYVVDKGPTSSAHAHSVLYKVTGPFVAGTAYASSDSIPDQVVTVNLKTGKTTPFIHNLQTAKGLVYLDGSGNEPVLSTGPAAASTTGADASATGRPAAAAITKPGSDSDTLALVLAIVALVLAAGAGAFGLMRRRPGAS
jgi:hypothetical protein